MAKADLPILKKADLIIDSKSRIGEGQFADLSRLKSNKRPGLEGTVYKAKWRGQIVAVKVLNSSTANIEGFYKEAQIMAKVGNHQNIVRLMGVCLEENHTSIVSQFYPQGSCYKVFVQEKRAVTWLNLLKVVKGAAAGILHLHAENYIHRDIASRNILISDSFEGVVTDFGMSRLQLRDGSQSITYLGPVKWMAPESIRDHVVSKATDVYMFGSFMWEVIMREIPYREEDPLVSAVRVIQQGCTLAMPTNCHPDYLKLMAQCLKTVPEERPTFVEILGSLEQMYEEAETKEFPPCTAPVPTRNPPTNTFKPSQEAGGNYVDSGPVFDLADLSLDSSPSPFSKSPASDPSFKMTNSSILSTNSSAGYVDTTPSAGYLDSSSLGFLPRPGFAPAKKTTSNSLPAISEGYLMTNSSNSSMESPKLSINANGYIFTTTALPKPAKSPMSSSGPVQSQPITMPTSARGKKSGSESLPNSLTAPSQLSLNSSSDSTGRNPPSQPISRQNTPSPPPVLPLNVVHSNSSVASSFPPRGGGIGPIPVSPTGSSPTPTAPPPSGGYNKRPLSVGGLSNLRFGNTSDSPMRSTITLYSNRVIPSPELLGWKPQFTLEHTFRQPSNTNRSSSTLSSSNSSTANNYPGGYRSLNTSFSSTPYAPTNAFGPPNPPSPTGYSAYNVSPPLPSGGSLSQSAPTHKVGPAQHPPSSGHRPPSNYGLSSSYSASSSSGYMQQGSNYGGHMNNMAPGPLQAQPPNSHLGIGQSSHLPANQSNGYSMGHNSGHGRPGLSLSGGTHHVSNLATSSGIYPHPGGSSSAPAGYLPSGSYANMSGSSPIPVSPNSNSGYPSSNSPLYPNSSTSSMQPMSSQSTGYYPSIGQSTGYQPGLKVSYPPVSNGYPPMSPTPSDYPSQPYYPSQPSQQLPSYLMTQPLPTQSQYAVPPSNYNKPLPNVPATSTNYQKPLPAVPNPATKKTGYPPIY